MTKFNKKKISKKYFASDSVTSVIQEWFLDSLEMFQTHFYGLES